MSYQMRQWKDGSRCDWEKKVNANEPALVARWADVQTVTPEAEVADLVKPSGKTCKQDALDELLSFKRHQL